MGSSRERRSRALAASVQRIPRNPDLLALLDGLRFGVDAAPQGLKPFVFLALYGPVRLRSGQAIKVVPMKQSAIDLQM